MPTIFNTSAPPEPADIEEHENADLPGYDPDAECNCYDCCAERASYSPDDHDYDSEYDPDGYDPDESIEQTDDEVVAPSAIDMPLLIPALPDRPSRLVSMEQEIGGSGESATKALYDAGLTSEPHMASYHSGRSEWCYVEEDGSVDGEIIYSRMRLDRPVQARRLDEAVTAVQHCMGTGDVRLDTRCGFHIHVGLGYDETAGTACYSMKSVESLYHLWNYLEDTIFRLASANWKHHRTEVADCNYAAMTAKGLSGARDVGRTLQHERNALNLGNFLQSRGYCRCGAFDFGEWSECTCELEKPTVEFRVFNATANKRKIRAYAALCLALVAYAEEHEVTAETHTPFDWSESTQSVDIEASEERLRFILRELSLTEAEREDIRYCAERSSLKDVVASIRPQGIPRSTGNRLADVSGRERFRAFPS